MNGECQVRDPHNVTDIGVTLAGAVTFDVEPDGDFVIPKEDFLLKESFVDNKKAKTAYKKPSEDVTGNLDLAGGTMRIHFVIGGRLLFRAGCDRNGENCIINEEKSGTQSTDVRGTLAFPDTMATACLIEPTRARRRRTSCAPQSIRREGVSECRQPQAAVLRACISALSRSATVR